MGTSLDLSAVGSFPLRQPGESLREYEERREAWRRTQAGGLGIPSAGPKFTAAIDGRELGEFQLSPGAGLPPPTHSRPPEPPPPPPPGRRFAPPNPEAGLPFNEQSTCLPWDEENPPPRFYLPERPPCRYPGFPPDPSRPARGAMVPEPVSEEAVRFGGPAGYIPPSLREPWDPVAPTADALEREAVLARTGFDLAWGAPPPRGGLAWDISRYVYAPVQDATGVGYRNLARDGLYLQAYQGASLGPDVWGVRWVSTASRPYRVLPSNEAYAAWLRVQQYEAIRRKGPEPELVSGAEESSKLRDPVGPITPIGVELPRRTNLAAFAWVPQEQLPFGCPYPYPYLPVPQEDFASGRWLAPDYEPSIPLPPPYDHVRWQCGLSPAPGSAKKGGGGGGPPPEDPNTDLAIMDVSAGLDDQSIHSSKASNIVVRPLLDVGLPAPGGNALSEDPEQLSRRLENLVHEQKSENEIIERVGRELEKERDPQERARLERLLRELSERARARRLEFERIKQTLREDHPDSTVAVPELPKVVTPTSGWPPAPPSAGGDDSGDRPRSTPGARRVVVRYAFIPDPKKSDLENRVEMFASAKRAVEQWKSAHPDDPQGGQVLLLLVDR